MNRKTIYCDYCGRAAQDSTREKWRPEVVRFADAMERKLRENDHKRHWSFMSMQYLSMRLTQERKELRAAVASGDASLVLDEAADVANFAMMIADVVRLAAPAQTEGGKVGDAPSEGGEDDRG